MDDDLDPVRIGLVASYPEVYEGFRVNSPATAHPAASMPTRASPRCRIGSAARCATRCSGSRG